MKYTFIYCIDLNKILFYNNRGTIASVSLNFIFILDIKGHVSFLNTV